MNDLILYIVKALVSNPDQVQVTEENKDGGVNFNLIVAPEDMGIVIGKSGQTIRAIRKLLISRAMAESRDTRVYLNLVETEKVTPKEA